MQFTRNIAFTKLVKTAGRLREFNFRRTAATDEPFFYVDVSDDRGNRIIFKMQKEGNGNWKIAEDQLPQWISSVETVLSEQIQEEMK